MRRSSLCVLGQGSSTTIWVYFTPSLSKSFASLSFHHTHSRVYSFLLKSVFPPCGHVVKSLEHSIYKGLKKISLCMVYAVSFLVLEGLIGDGTLINCRFFAIWRCLFHYQKQKERRPTQMGLIIISEIHLVATQVASNQII